MAKHEILRRPIIRFKRALAVATVLLTMLASMQLSVASAVEPEPAMVKNINDMTLSSFSQNPADNEGSVVIGSTLYFNVAGGLWKSDGTNQGTELVKQFDPNLTWRISPYVMGAKIYFSADDGVNGAEFWESDGSTAGTKLLKDINVGLGGSAPFEFEQISGSLYFFANNGTTTDLWKSDGTAIGTVIHRSNAALNVGELTAVGTSLFFRGSDSTNGAELWTSEGPSGATMLLVNIRPNSVNAQNEYQKSSYPTSLTVANGKLFFTANDSGTSQGDNRELWTSDGTVGGTAMVKEIFPGSSLARSPSYLTSVGLTVFFSANGGDGIELWKSDGTVGGTAMVKDINLASGVPALPGKIIKHPTQDVVYFSADDGSGLAMWESDGTPENTVAISDSTPNGTYPQIEFPTFLGTDLFFVLSAGSSYGELWKYNGTTTVLVRVARSPSSNYVDLQILNAAGSNLFLNVFSIEQGRELWAVNSTAVSGVLVKDITTTDYSGYAVSADVEVTSVGSVLFFVGNDGRAGEELWKSDGTADGTVMVKDINLGSGYANPGNFAAVGNTLYFSADDGTNGKELWKSDGTADGTVMVKDIRPGSGSSSNPTSLTAVGNTLYFRAKDGTNGEELWKSDGTVEGTVMVKDIYAEVGESSNIDRLTAVGDTLYFKANDGINGTELWKSDGTVEGTVMVKDINVAVGESSDLWNFIAVGNTIYFLANDGINGAELWKSDGTFGGTVMVKDIQLGIDGSFPRDFAVVGGTLYFSASDDANARELWKSDGTANGTVMVKDIYAGLGYGNPTRLTAVGNTLYFSADDGVNGEELWKSDGTVEGTVIVKDINVDGDSYTRYFKAVGDRLFFGADNGTAGRELWSFSTSSVPGGSQPSNPGSSNSDSQTATPTSPVLTEPSVTKVVRFSKFMGDSGKLPALASKAIAKTMSGYSQIDRVVCTGFTSGVKATALGRKVALQRAHNACTVVKRSAPQALIQVRVNVASGVGPKFRTVQLSITGN